MFIYLCKSRLYKNFRLAFLNNLGLCLDDNILQSLAFLLLKTDFLSWSHFERKVEDQLGQMAVESLSPDFSKFVHGHRKLFRPKNFIIVRDV